MDTWDDKQIKTLSLGGNKRLKDLLQEYSVPNNSDPEFRYFIYLLDYYRRLLKSEVNGEEAPEKPSVIEALNLLSLGTNNQSSLIA